MMARLMVFTLFISVMGLNGNHGLAGNGGLAVPNTVISNELTQKQQNYPVRGEIRQTYQLTPNANIEVTGIEGSVEVETTPGGTVEIHFVREALTQVDYDCETILVQHSANSLVVRHQTKTGNQCQVIQARERMKLVVPRSANLNFSNIEGTFSVGATDGFLRLNQIEGFVRVGQAQAAEISLVEGGLLLNVAQVSPAGINIHNIEGSLELGVTEKLNADLRVDGHSGNVQSDLPNAQTGAFGQKDYRLRLGVGGAAISISRIEGSVRIRRF